MRVRVGLIGLLLVLSACSDDAPTRPGADYIDRATEIADQLERRSTDLEETGGP